jgi:hypothetical protein
VLRHVVNKHSGSGWNIGIVGLLVLSTAGALFAAVPPEVKCADLKAKAAAAAVYARVQCDAKAVLAGTSVDPKCLLKAESKLRASFTKADAKGACPGDAEAALTTAGTCSTTLGQLVSGDPSCAAIKLKGAGLKARDDAACAGKPADKGSEALAKCLAKAATKFAKTIAKADEKGTCTGTASELEESVDACVVALPPGHCNAAGYATCGGACPDGLTCRPYEVFANGASTETGCSCVDVVNGPKCGAPVCSVDRHCDDPSFVCEQWLDGDPLGCDHTICQPALTTPPSVPPGGDNTTVCDGGSEFPTCGGTCPDGMRCQALEGFFEGETMFAGCLCVDPRAPRCGAGPDCDIEVLPYSHCADPSLTCLVTLGFEGGDKPFCLDAHCGVAVPTTTTVSTTSTSSVSSTSSSSTSSTSTTSSSTTTTTIPCVSTPSVSGCFEDLGNCTIRDNCTGLQWEKKQTVPGPHDVNNRYVWAGCCGDGCQTMCQPNAAAAATCVAMAEHNTDGCGTQCPDGGGCYVERGGLAITTIFDWINQLNAENFAGHSDWRVPTEAGFNPSGSRELESIVRSPCGGVPCIDPIFGPTIGTGYWSRTGDVNRSVDAWFVNFFDGPYSNLQKREALFVRAVR